MTAPSGLWLHRVGIILITPFAWAAATLAYLALAPFQAAEEVWLYGLKKHWSDQ